MTAHRSKLALTTAFAFVAALVVAVPAPAHAQFGGLLKKAKEKAAEKVAEKAVDKAVDKAAGGSDSASKANGTTNAGAAAPSDGARRGGRASRILGRGD